jgi:hypothetical protein
MWVYKLLYKGEAVYVGATTSHRYRIRLDGAKHSARKGSNRPIAKFIREVGEEHLSIEPIEKCSTVEQLSRSEIYWIAYYLANGCPLHNASSGGEGLKKKGSVHTKEQKQIWSTKRRGTISGERNPNWGKCGEASHMYGREVSAETKLKASQSKLGRLNPNYGKKYTEAERLARSLETRGIPRPKSAKSAHTRWHTNKGVRKPDSCKYCSEELATL